MMGNYRSPRPTVPQMLDHHRDLDAPSCGHADWLAQERLPSTRFGLCCPPLVIGCEMQ
jgi:hypothetical protein